MPRWWVAKVQDALNEDGKALKNANVLVLGVAYKKDIQDMRECPSIDIIKLLQERGANVSYHDPHVPSFNDHGLAMTSVSDLDAALAAADVRGGGHRPLVLRLRLHRGQGGHARRHPQRHSQGPHGGLKEDAFPRNGRMLLSALLLL